MCRIFCLGTSNLEKLRTLQKKLIKLLENVGFQLQKLTYEGSEVLADIPSNPKVTVRLKY